MVKKEGGEEKCSWVRDWEKLEKSWFKMGLKQFFDFVQCNNTYHYLAGKRNSRCRYSWIQISLLMLTKRINLCCFLNCGLVVSYLYLVTSEILLMLFPVELSAKVLIWHSEELNVDSKLLVQKTWESFVKITTCLNCISRLVVMIESTDVRPQMESCSVFGSNIVSGVENTLRKCHKSYFWRQLKFKTSVPHVITLEFTVKMKNNVMLVGYKPEGSWQDKSNEEWQLESTSVGPITRIEIFRDWEGLLVICDVLVEMSFVKYGCSE